MSEIKFNQEIIDGVIKEIHSELKRHNSEVLFTVPPDLHINRIGFGKGELANVQPNGFRNVYYKADKVLLALLKKGYIKY